MSVRIVKYTIKHLPISHIFAPLKTQIIMKYKVGDRVKFLMEEGEGIVRKIVGPNLVNVETEDGFEIPTLTRDIILIQTNTHEEKMFVKNLDDSPTTFVNEEVESPIIEEKETNSSRLIVYPSDRIPEKFHLSIAFIPEHQNMPIAGDLDIYMMNFSSYDIMYSYHNQNDKSINLVSSGKIEAFSKLYVTSINREELDAYLNANVQTLIIQHQAKQLFAPISADMKLRGSKFYKETSFPKDQFLLQNALIYKLFDFKNVPLITKLSTEEDTDILKAKASVHKKNDAILKHKVSNDRAEVDMHIWELVDDHSRMTNTEMLDIQLGYFEKCLQSAIDHKFSRVIFIHGVGSGRLKEEIKATLEPMDNIEYKPASMAQYGVGATQVDLHLGSQY